MGVGRWKFWETMLGWGFKEYVRSSTAQTTFRNILASWENDSEEVSGFNFSTLSRTVSIEVS